MIQIAPSILSADFSRLGEQVREALDAGARRIHVDVMDGMFVPNITMGPHVVECIRPLAEQYGAILEVHLMIVQPERYLADFAKAGGDVLIVHVETCPSLRDTLASIRKLGVRAGVTLNPDTPVETLQDVLEEADHILIMSVNPGFSGQEFMPGSLERIARVKAMLAQANRGQVLIEVDGGINQENIAAVARAGADIAVAASAVFNQKASVAANIQALRTAARA